VVVAAAIIVVPRVGPSHAATDAAATLKAGTGSTLPAPPFALVSTTPASAAAQVPSDATLAVHLSDPVSPSSPTPTLTPAVAGQWELLTPTTFTFIASAPLVPSSTETLTVPADVTSTSHQQLGTATTVQFGIAAGSTLRLQEMLASLGYLPVAFTASGAPPPPNQLAVDQPGTFAWRWNEPASLESLWSQGTPNVITKGAVMAFEDQHGLATDGVPGPAVWGALLAAVNTGTMDSAPYDYVYVSQVLPETTTVYSNGNAVYSTPANTGVAAAPTNIGTFPVYERFVSTTMSGTNPNGTKYVDPGIPWVSYFSGGDALHGFVRSSYGFPQSVGCVEMPPANAAVVYPLTPIGTLVTVS
jgi:peptidoglycan hydrolase-like protein with peptidoglycan-binding domain